MKRSIRSIHLSLMGIDTMKRRQIYFLMISVLLNCGLTAQDGRDTIPFHLTSYNNIVLDALINDVDSVRLMFHTAANEVSLIEASSKDLNSIRWNDKASGIKSWGGSSGVLLHS